MKPIFFLLLIIFSILTFLYSNGLTFNNNAIHYFKYEKALQLAQKENKILMIKLTAEHCQYCKKMDREVFTKKEVISTLNKNFIAIEIDVDKDSIPLNIKRTMTPTFIFVNKNQKIISKIPGSWNKKDFLDILKSVKNKKEK